MNIKNVILTTSHFLSSLSDKTIAAKSSKSEQRVLYFVFAAAICLDFVSGSVLIWFADVVENFSLLFYLNFL